MNEFFYLPLMRGRYEITVKKTVISVSYIDNTGWKNTRKMRLRRGGSAVNYTATFHSISNPEGPEGIVNFIENNLSWDSRNHGGLMRLCDYVITYGF